LFYLQIFKQKSGVGLRPFRARVVSVSQIKLLKII